VESVLCLALTNLRIGELLSIQWGDIDWVNRQLTVNKSVWRGKLVYSTKPDAEVVKHLPESLLRVLQWQSAAVTAHRRFRFCILQARRQCLRS